MDVEVVASGTRTYVCKKCVKMYVSKKKPRLIADDAGKKNLPKKGNKSLKEWRLSVKSTAHRKEAMEKLSQTRDFNCAILRVRQSAFIFYRSPPSSPAYCSTKVAKRGGGSTHYQAAGIFTLLLLLLLHLIFHSSVSFLPAVAVARVRGKEIRLRKCSAFLEKKYCFWNLHPPQFSHLSSK